MKKLNAKTLCEGAIVAALTVVLLLAGTYVPVLNLFAVFVCGLPLTYLMLKRGAPVTVMAFAVSLFAMFALTGDMVTTCLTSCAVLLPGIAAGWALSGRHGYYAGLFIVIATVLVGVVINVMFINGFAGDTNGISGMIDSAIESVRSAFAAAVQEASDAAGADLSETLDLLLAQTKNMVLTYFPTFLIIYSMIVGYAVLSSAIFFMRRLRVKSCSYVRFSMLKVPRSMSLILVLLMLITMFSDSTSIVMLALKNTVAILSFVLAADGLSLVDYALKKKIQSGYARFGVYTAVMILGYFLISVIFYILMIVGMIDSGRDLRKLKRVGGDNES